MEPDLSHVTSLLKDDTQADMLTSEPVRVARAPGRLDVMGGVADYSGSIVLEATLDRATLAAIQRRSDGRIRLRSEAGERLEEAAQFECPAGEFGEAADCGPEETIRFLSEHGAPFWTRYVLGCLAALRQERPWSPPENEGFSLALWSDVPLGAGVSSSASVEVAAMLALCAHYRIRLDGLEMARLCQWAENRIAGAPCGIMDQVAACLGRQDSLVVIDCRPCRLAGVQPIPEGWRFVGIDSGVRHNVGGSAYRRARIGAFMGLRYLQLHTGQDWGGYLCSVPAAAWEACRPRLPERVAGAEFLRDPGGYPDRATRVDSDMLYAVRSCAEHPVAENRRVREFLALMNLAFADPSDPMLLREAGQLMLASHRSYSENIGLGSEETDLLVALAEERGPRGGLFGAKITGGGCGGTVAVLCHGEEAEAAISAIRVEYERRTGLQTTLFAESSPGALQWGVRTLTGA